MRLFLAQGATSRAPVRIGQVPFRRDAGLEFRVVAVGEQRQVEYFPEKRSLLDFGVLRPDGIRKQMAMAQEQEEQTEGVKVHASGRAGGWGGVGWSTCLVAFSPSFRFKLLDPGATEISTSRSRFVQVCAFVSCSSSPLGGHRESRVRVFPLLYEPPGALVRRFRP
jgi:hypothetical protein